MKDLNRVFILGRLGAKPIRRETKSGVAVVNLSVATSRRIPQSSAATGTEQATELTGSDSGSEFKEETQWHKVVVWGKQGENCVKFLETGQKVLVEGEMRSRAYKDLAGEERMSFEVHADQVSFL